METVTLPTPINTEWENHDGSQIVNLLWTDFDIIHLPKGLAILQDQDDGRILVMPQATLHKYYTQTIEIDYED